MMTKIREGYKETEIGVIPEDWDVTRICDVSSFISNGFVGTASPYYSNDENSTLYLMGNNVRENYIDKRTLVRINDEFTEKYPKSRIFKDDMLTVQSGHIGTSCIVTEEFDNAHCHAVIITRFDKNKVNPDYQAYYINSVEGKSRLKSLFVGTTIKHINTKDLKVFNIPLPPLQEQQRIAEILSTTDDHIEKLDKIIEDYQLLKKGMMKKLLTEGIGHSEFKETEIGRIPREWEVVPLSEVAEIVSGGTPKTSISEYWECGDVMWATPTDITSNGKYIIKTEKLITEAGLKNSSATLLPIGTILMTSRATIGERCINKYPMSTNQGFKSFICKENCDNEFLYYYIEILKPEIIKNSSGSTFLEISKSKIEVLLIALPRIDEQKSIAEILSGIDEIIYCFENERFEFLQLKKSLMEKLLTGKVRV